MVDHHVENAFAQKAVLRACADHIQVGETFSTPKIAPATPMQAWKKPSHCQESPDTLPSLSLGRSSAEMKAARVDFNMPPSTSTSMPTMCGPVSASATSRIPAGMEHKEDLLSFSLSKYEKSFGMATSLRNGMGPSAFHGVCLSSGKPAMLPTGNSVFSHADQIYVNVGVADERNLQTLSLPSKSEPDTSTAERLCIAGKSYTPVPGEVANDAYKLYSELFPVTSDTANGKLCTSVSGGLHPSPFVGQVDDKALPSEACGSKNLAQARCARNKDSPRVGKKLKLSNNEGRATSKSFPLVKEEPVFEEAYGLHESSGCREAFSARVIESNLKDDLRSCKENVQRDVTVLNCSRVPGPMTANGVSSVDCLVDVKPAVGSLKFATLSKDMPLHASSFGSQAGEPSGSIAPTIGAWESPVQGSPSVDTDWGKFLALSATPLNEADTEFLLPFQQRFKVLQAFLKGCDEADQNEQLEGLRALPAASRNGYAVELETRAIRLSLEEGRELQRMRLLNVLGRVSENSFEELGGTPHGPRLPVLGASSPFAHVP